MRDKLKLKYKVSEIPADVKAKIYSKFLMVVGILILAIILAITLKNIMYFSLFGILSILYALTLFHTLYLFCADKVSYFEGSIVKIVNLSKLKKKYKDIYLKTESDEYFIMQISRKKSGFELGVKLRVFLLPDSVHRKGANTLRIHNPLLICNIGEEYIEGESSEAENGKTKKKNIE
ncbi:MAG: hypothetical protein IKB01_05750 [Lachnospiraceae bacterium]|nr:hypothetical protein [Lachnospiraceae bacterium]